MKMKLPPPLLLPLTCPEEAARCFGTERVSLYLWSPVGKERETGKNRRRWTGKLKLKGNGKGKEMRRGMAATGAILLGWDRVLQGELRVRDWGTAPLDFFAAGIAGCRSCWLAGAETGREGMVP